MLGGVKRVKWVNAWQAHRQMTLGLYLAKKHTYCRGQGWLRVFIGDEVGAQLWEGQQVVWVAYRQSDDAPI